MSLVRGIYGIEYNPRPPEEGSGGLKWIVAIVGVVAVISLSWSLVKRFSSRSPQETSQEEVRAEVRVEGAEVQNIATNAVSEEVREVQERVSTDVNKRPPAVTQLLMRLEEAEKRNDLEMAVNTIESLRALPGSPAADLDDSLARRLGDINMVRLLKFRNAQWVKEVTVKRGDSASRIASENGATMASLVSLNGKAAEKPVIGRKLYVMNHPRFRLVIHRRSRTADLSLNGKFFRRYDLLSEVKGSVGAYLLPERKRQFWKDVGVELKPDDRNELEMLLPTGVSVLISDM